MLRRCTSILICTSEILPLERLVEGRRVVRTRRVSRARGRSAIRTRNAPDPGGHYSQGINAGDHIYVSGSGPFDPATHKIVGQDIQIQTTQTLKNIKAILHAAGVSMDDVVKVTVYLRDMKDFVKMDQVYMTFFPRNPPARTTIHAGLYGKGRRITVDAIAVRMRG